MKLLLNSFLIFFILSGCTIQQTPSINLSFDDRSIDSWYNIKDLFQKYDVKVTFFITQIDSLSVSDIVKLRELEEEGHEIGYHGNIHVVSEYYIKENSYIDYIENEINPGLDSLKSLGFNPISFAYPYGSKYWFTDFLLYLKGFEYTRNVTPRFGEDDLTKLDIYSSQNSWDFRKSALEIDANAKVSIEMLDLAFQKVVDEHKIIYLYAHTPTKEENPKAYNINIKYLESVFVLSKKYNLKFTTFKNFANE
ncbi:polysaccharide deacetylase family protein [Flammeovirga agarivorans]|uniref:Polysaccharide deacetylase family protein n=1 Tax=Flammeovirga agarivorans TaxID=2726742 RepID=A0A7X8XXL9_9BACT|nr:polysaccharide deacetylase family protein [Flammeovirga agarivorans]NLR93215.1 polysaccharide deacetylase family protein [Flammeovirga agarivorans]